VLAVLLVVLLVVLILSPRFITCSFFAPNINIVRDVRWGRAQETYGEDPTLTGKMGVAYVSGMQYMGKPAVYKAGGPVAVRNVAKHFAAYNIESNFAGRNGPLTKPAEIAKADGQVKNI